MPPRDLCGHRVACTKSIHLVCPAPADALELPGCQRRRGAPAYVLAGSRHQRRRGGIVDAPAGSSHRKWNNNRVVGGDQQLALIELSTSLHSEACWVM